MTILEISIRLLIALILGAMIGLNRGVKNKRSGLRTHAMVTLGAAIASLAILIAQDIDDVSIDAISRVIQGILTGIGFLGAGVIIKHKDGNVSGLITAATVWISGVLGTICGFGNWKLILVSTVLILFVLLFGGHIEKVLIKLFDKHK
jgi:putative Mg2+ transporter-C (MgtC) family protein